jgi:hypothetical protein
MQSSLVVGDVALHVLVLSHMQVQNQPLSVPLLGQSPHCYEPQTSKYVQYCPFWPQVTDGSTVLEVHNGVAMLTKITAAGCSVTALIAGFLAVAQPNETLLATAAALAVFG